jgi:uncharacterized membrane protein YeaQ/YmgE (transglycosylase-associated protein family)
VAILDPSRDRAAGRVMTSTLGARNERPPATVLCAMPVDACVVWIAVGLVAGTVTGVRGRSGAFRDLAAAVVGAVLAGLVFRFFRVRPLAGGMLGTVAIAALGAAFLLCALRVVRGARV